MGSRRPSDHDVIRVTSRGSGSSSLAAPPIAPADALASETPTTKHVSRIKLRATELQRLEEKMAAFDVPSTVNPKSPCMSPSPRSLCKRRFSLNDGADESRATVKPQSPSQLLKQATTNQFLRVPSPVNKADIEMAQACVGRSQPGIPRTLSNESIRELEGKHSRPSVGSSNSSADKVLHFSDEDPEFWSPEQASDEGDGLRRTISSRIKTIALSDHLNWAMGVLVVANMIMMGVELDVQPASESSNIMLSYVQYPAVPASIFETCEVFFFVAFSLELLVRVIYQSPRVWRDVGTYIDAVALLPVILQAMLKSKQGKHFMLIRVVRLMKLFRLLRLIRVFKELAFLVKSIVSALQTLGWVGVLLFIAVYCAAVACTMMIGHNNDFDPANSRIKEYEAQYGFEVDVRRYWSSIPRSMLTLFQIFTLDNWSVVVRPVVETHLPWMFFFFVAFIFLTSFGLLNLLMGAIVDHTMSAAREADAEHERLLQEGYKQIMIASGRLFSLCDKNRNGLVTTGELLSFLRENDLKSALEHDMESLSLRVDYVELTDILLGICEEWRGVDEGGGESDGITMEEFVGAAMRLAGPARSEDLVATMITSKTILGRVESLERSMQLLHASVESVCTRVEKRIDSLGRVIPGGGSPVRSQRPKNTWPFAQAPVPVLLRTSDSRELESRSASASSSTPRSRCEDMGDEAMPPSLEKGMLTRRTSRVTQRRPLPQALPLPGEASAAQGLKSQRQALDKSARRRMSSVLQAISKDSAFANAETTTILNSYATNYKERTPSRKTSPEPQSSGRKSESRVSTPGKDVDERSCMPRFRRSQSSESNHGLGGCDETVAPTRVRRSGSGNAVEHIHPCAREEEERLRAGTEKKAIKHMQRSCSDSTCIGNSRSSEEDDVARSIFTRSASGHSGCLDDPQRYAPRRVVSRSNRAIDVPGTIPQPCNSVPRLVRRPSPLLDAAEDGDLRSAGEASSEKTGQVCTQQFPWTQDREL
eukprot:TRINITY_DN7042_c0_g1_i2.p1 TRINITY_DN7042_c0_g1~~TRINITY_DN7042_c0_g1_i2.p1  ORF type:complete len:991 (+),score=109.05 TRINITY_DN7042_c0_g1_i2:63-3035(+)